MPPKSSLSYGIKYKVRGAKKGGGVAPAQPQHGSPPVATPGGQGGGAAKYELGAPYFGREGDDAGDKMGGEGGAP